MFRRKISPTSKQRNPYTAYILGFLLIGGLAAITFYQIANYDKDVEKIANENIQKQNEFIAKGYTETNGERNDSEQTDTEGLSQEGNTEETEHSGEMNVPPQIEGENGKESPPASEPKDLVLKPENSFYPLPVVTEHGNEINLNGETFTKMENGNLNDFFLNALQNIDKKKSVLVTELERNESMSDTTKTMRLREYKLDYDQLLLEKTIQEKYGDEEPFVAEKTYANSHGMYISYPSMKDEEGNPRTTTASFGDIPLTKDNLLEKTSIFNHERSPYHLIQQFATIPQTRVQYSLAENDKYYLLYFHDTEELMDTKKFKFEAYWFEKDTGLPAQVTLYETVIKDNNHDYSHTEYVYTDWDKQMNITLPNDTPR